MICQFVGGPIDGERREMGDAPPTAWNVAYPPKPVVFADATDQLSESMVPGYMTYYRHAFVERHSRAALYAYFCGVEVTSVVPIVLGGQLYLTRPRDIQNVGANVLAKMFRAWCWTSGTWSSTSHQRGVHDVGATYADGIRVQFRQGP